jgi:hypothetical protein
MLVLNARCNITDIICIMQHTTRITILPFRDKDELLDVRIISNTQVPVHFMDGVRSFNVKEGGTYSYQSFLKD